MEPPSSTIWARYCPGERVIPLNCCGDKSPNKRPDRS